MTSKHTTGQWFSAKSFGDGMSVIAETGQYYVVVPAERHQWMDGDVEAADARLLSAAPDLLEAAHNALADGLPDEVARSVRDAIAKAEGR